MKAPGRGDEFLMKPDVAMTAFANGFLLVFVLLRAAAASAAANFGDRRGLPVHTDWPARRVINVCGDQVRRKRLIWIKSAVVGVIRFARKAIFAGSLLADGGNGGLCENGRHHLSV